ncbi:fibronectin type III domain-containing protein [Tenacibaculum sp. MAR_2009_124]|uniref:fibronectin type III domain-containing protein n=1 Tax=Tenacibaculum sp. MAR_2009_124 TaxID=1250059 RepID=UPI000B804426|nr:fibronectin type III domain-containing protein [Tenacibaculum sp. MAR_2009_124]
MKKLLLGLLLISGYVMGQYNSDAPWMKNLDNRENRSLQRANNKITLSEISAAFNDYWKDKDYTEKGVGYKPFKRWEYNVKSMLLPDGTIPSAKYLFDTNIEEHQKFGSTSNISNWTSTGPMTERTGQGRINVAIVDPNNSDIYYVGAPAGGLWKSDDKGTTWQPLTDKLPAIGVSGIVIDPNDSNIIYISTGDDDNADSYGLGVFKTIDGGRTWNTNAIYTPDIGEYGRGGELYMHPNNSNILWNATSQGLYKTTDAGKSWNLILEGWIRDLKLKPNNPDVIYAVGGNSGDNKFFKSIDGGRTFVDKSSNIGRSLDRLVIDVTPMAPENLYVLVATETNAGSQSGGVLYKSENEGNSFIELNRSLLSIKQAWYDWSLAVSDTNPEHIAIGSIFGSISTDGGRTFLGTWYGHADVHFLRYYKGVLFCGNDGGFVTIDERNTFKDHSKGLNIGQYYKINIADLNSSDTNMVIGGTQDNGGQFFQNNSWKHWHHSDGMDCAIGSLNEGLLYGLKQHGEMLFMSNDFGQSYSSIVKPNEEKYTEWVVASDINSKDEMYVGYKALYKADMENNTFIKLHNFGIDIQRIIINDNNDNMIFVLCDDGKIYKSIDAGKTFSSYYVKRDGSVFNIELSQDNSNQIWFVTENLRGVMELHGANSIEQTANNTITLVSNDLPRGINVIKHQPYSNILYAGTVYGLFYKNGDNRWERYDNNLPNVPIRDIEISSEDKIIVAGTYGRGVWKSPIPDGNRVSCALDVPSRLNAVLISEGALVNWNGEQKLEDYEVAYRKVNDREWITKPTGVNKVLLRNTEFQAGVEYEAKVRSTCNGVYSNYSEVVKFTWLDSEPPTVPYFLSAFNIKKRSVDLSWGDSSDNSGISHYEIYNQIGRESLLLDRTRGTESYFTTEVLTASTEYNIYVVAVDLNGNRSEPSEIVKFSTMSRFMPDAPQNLTAINNTGTQVVLKWDAPRGPEEVKKYEVYDYQYGLIGTTTDTQLLLDKLPTNYRFLVYVVGVGIENVKSDKSNEFGFVLEGVNDRQPNPPVDIVVANDVHTNVVLQWKVPRGNVAISHYKIYLWGDYYLEDFNGGGKKEYSSQTTEVTITDLAPGRLYWGNIIAFSEDGAMSIPSENFEVSVQRDRDRTSPSIPENLNALHIEASSLELVWDRSMDDVGVAYYEVFEKVDGRNVSLGQVGETTMRLERLVPFSQHIYKVSATDFEGNTSELSKHLIVWTLHEQFPERPHGLGVRSVTESSFDASWRTTKNTDHYYVSSFDGVNIKEFGPLRSANYVFENIGTPYLFWRVIAENGLGRMYSSWELTSLGTRESTINIVLNGNESQQAVVVSRAYENATYNLFSLNGILIRSGVVKEGEVNVMNLKKGVYILKIDNDLKPFTRKVVIE